jgi:radical SAM superfamily enzyme YgiQ (UPF0313 family)
VKVALLAPAADFARSYGEGGMARRSCLDGGHGLVPGVTPPMGLLYVAAALRRAGHEASLFDLNHHPVDEVVAGLRRAPPDWMGISVTGCDWPRCRELARRLREALPGPRLVAGGPLPDAWAQKCLEEEPAFDFAVTGDGELSAPALCAALADPELLPDVPGLAWRREGVPVRNPGACWRQDIDAYPHPAWDLIDLRRYQPAIGYYKSLPNATVVGSRGCPFRCLHCHTANEAGGRVRWRGAPDILAELEELVERRGVRDVIFWDNNITLNAAVLTEVCEGILSRRWRISWCGATRATRADPALLSLMRRSGCWRLLFGVESGVQKNVDVLRRGEDLEAVRAGIRAVRAAGIEVFATFIFGIPTETYEEGLATIRFALDCGADYAKFFALGVHPGTPLYEDWPRYGRLLSFQDAQSQHRVGFVPHTMTPEQVQDLLRLAYRRFYGRPSYMLRRFWRMRSLEDLRQNVRGWLAFR